MLRVVSADNYGFRSCHADTAGRRLGLLLEVPEIQFIARVRGSFSVHRRPGGLSLWGCAFFALLRVVPELSASFRALDDEEFFVVEGSLHN